MKILAINGSPRKGGNTEALLDKALEGVKSIRGARVNKITLNDLDISPCQNCSGCDETGVCVIDDDMTKIYRALRKADGIIMASPIYFGSVSAQSKAMIDRLQSFWVAKYSLKKDLFSGRPRPGIFLCVGGHDTNRFFKNAKEIVKIFFTVLNVDYKTDLFCPGVDKIGDMACKKICLEKAYKLGQGMARWCKR